MDDDAAGENGGGFGTLNTNTEGVGGSSDLNSSCWYTARDKCRDRHDKVQRSNDSLG